MQLFVKTLTSQTIVIDTESTSTVSELAQLIGEKEGIPAEEIRIIFSGKQLEGGKTLAEYSIDRDCVVNMVLRLRGGFRPVDNKSDAKQGWAK